MRQMRHLRHPATQRKRIVKKLDAIEASQRAIADVVGVSRDTVQRDLSEGGRNRPSDTEENHGVTDGKNAGSPETVENREFAEGEDGRNRPPDVGPTLDPEPAPAPRYGVIVIDPPWPMEKIRRDVRPSRCASGGIADRLDAAEKCRDFTAGPGIFDRSIQRHPESLARSRPAALLVACRYRQPHVRGEVLQEVQAALASHAF